MVNLAESPTDEEQWRDAVKNLDKQMVLYKEAQGRKDEAEINGATERVAVAIENLTEKHPDPKMKQHFKAQAQTLRSASAQEKESVMKEIGKGLLVLLTTPFALISGVLLVVGELLGGLSAVLKGFGKLAKGAVYRGTRTGN